MPHPTPNIHPKNAKEWRAWLDKNHEKEDMVWLIRWKKHTGKPSPTSQEAMDEAICYGWIDTTIRRIDEDLWAQCFRKRKRNAKWSKNTLSYARRLTKDGRMKPQGMRAYELAKDRKPHDHGIPENPEEPEELVKALEESGALKAWESLAPSNRRTHLRWLFRAKQAQTRKKRITVIVRNAKEGLALGPNTTKVS